MGGRGSVGALEAPGPGDKVESGQVPRPPLASGCASPGSHPSFLRSLPDLKVIGPHHCAWDPWRESGATGVSPGDKGAIVPGGRRALWGGERGVEDVRWARGDTDACLGAGRRPSSGRVWQPLPPHSDSATEKDFYRMAEPKSF